MNQPISLTNNQVEIQYLEAVVKAARTEQLGLRALLDDDQITLIQYEKLTEKFAVDIAELEERITILR